MGYGKITGAAAAALVVVALGGCETMNALLDDKPAGQTESENPQSASAQTQTMALAAQDADFVQQADEGGSTEVALGQFALERSKNKAVLAFAQEMVDDHSKAGDALKALADQRGVQLPRVPSADEAAAAAGLLEGKAFDKAYADLMVEKHEAAVALFETEAAEGSDPALKAFAEETLPTLRTHLEHARTLQSSL